MTVIATSTAATATAFSNQRKVDRCQNGVLWSMFWDGTATTTTSMHFRYSTDDGATWNASTGFGFTNTGASHIPNASMFIDLDDYAHVAYKDRNDGYMYYRRGTPNVGRTAWTWSGAFSLSGALNIINYPDIVAHREGSGWAVHIVGSVAFDTSNDHSRYTRLTVTSGGGITIVVGFSSFTSGYGNTQHKWPSIDFNHTGDGKTVAGSTPHLYAAWSAGASGAGKGIRFKKATYSGGAWTWGTEREIDSTRHISSDNRWLNCLFDGTRVIIPAFLGTASRSILLYERNAADTLTETRVLASTTSDNDHVLSGASTYDGKGNVYFFGDNGLVTTPDNVQFIKWNRGTNTLDARQVIDATSNGSAWLSVKRGYSNGRIEFIYTDGTASPYSVTYGAITLNAAPTAPTVVTQTINPRWKNELPHTHNDPDGNPQAGFDIEIREDGGATVFSDFVLTADESYRLGNDILVEGIYQRRVRTYDAEGAGAWSGWVNLTCTYPAPPEARPNRPRDQIQTLANHGTASPYNVTFYGMDA